MVANPPQSQRAISLGPPAPAAPCKSVRYDAHMRSYALGVVILLGLSLPGCSDKDKVVPSAAPPLPTRVELADAQRAAASDPDKLFADAVSALVDADYADAAKLAQQFLDDHSTLEPTRAALAQVIMREARDQIERHDKKPIEVMANDILNAGGSNIAGRLATKMLTTDPKNIDAKKILKQIAALGPEPKAALLAYETERRLEPSAAGNPTHATVRLLRKIGEGDWDLKPLLSETRGLFIRLVVDEGEHFGNRYCGAKLKFGRKQAMYFFKYVIERLEYDDVKISCSNKPRPPRCSVGMAGHDHPRFEMRFADTEKGLELVAIIEFNFGGSEAAEKAEVAAVEAELARLTASPCPQ